MMVQLVTLEQLRAGFTCRICKAQVPRTDATSVSCRACKQTYTVSPDYRKVDA